MQHDGRASQEAVEAVIPVQLPLEAANNLVPGGVITEVGEGLHGPDDQARFVPQEGRIFEEGQGGTIFSGEHAAEMVDTALAKKLALPV